jgi:hypothetical protein
VLGCADADADDALESDQRYYLEKAFRRAAELNGADGRALPLIGAITALVRAESPAQFASFVARALGGREPSPFFTNSSNHGVTEELVDSAIRLALRARESFSLDSMLSSIVRFNCSTAISGDLGAKASLVPKALDDARVKLELSRCRIVGGAAIDGLRSAGSIGEFLAGQVRRTRALDRWVPSEDVGTVLERLMPSLSEAELRRYACATSGPSGEAEILRAIARREPWVKPGPGVEDAVYTDVGGTLFDGDEPIVERIHRLRDASESGVRVVACTSGSAVLTRDKLWEHGLRVPVIEKRTCSGRDVLLHFDDRPPECEVDAPNPVIYIHARERAGE